MQIEVVATGCYCVHCLMSDGHDDAFGPCRGVAYGDPKHTWRFDDAVILFFQHPVNATHLTLVQPRRRPGATAGLQ